MELLGSDLQFVTKPSHDYFCPVCTEILTDPHLSDCGHHLCGSCRDRLLADNKAECPECKEPNLLKSARLNKQLQRQVKDLAVYCSHHEEGCKWKGELRNLQEHLDPTKRRCGYVRVPCSFQCGELMRSGAVKEHKKSHCRKRPYTCRYCGYHNALDVVTEQHMPACRQFPVDCPNNCETKRLKRHQLQSHIKQCPLEIVPCSFSSIGCTCTTRLPRKEMEAHEEQTWRQHLKLVLKAIEPKQEETATIVTPPPLDTLYLVNLPPVKFTIMDYVERKLAGEEWVSPPFYSHPQGYKMRLEVASTNNQESLSVYVHILQGEYDDELIWPFEGRVSVELVNWKEDKGHHEENFDMNILTTRDYSMLHVCKNDSRSIAGNPHFIPHSSLSYNPASNTKYLHDDCLCVRVKSVDVYSTHLVHKTPSWQDSHLASSKLSPLCEFTLTEFSKRKQVDNRFYSPSFCTHHNGLEMCIVVDANGSSSGKGSHISVFVAPAVKEQNDHNTTLQPFECDAVVELLNWTEDKEHFSRTISLNSNSLYMHNNAFGISIIYCRFIKHSSLSFDTATNTEYLQDDCLRMRVKSVEFYSTPATCSSSEQSSLLQVTLTEFSKRRQFDNSFFSSPFYSHPQGYKLCLRCNANNSEKTHLSALVYLMRGEHDDHLHWPCDCSIGIELVNWREDRGHMLKWTSIVSSRVIDSDIVSGRPQFVVSHASLACDLATNIEYLHDDCLLLRAVGVEVYSTDLFLKTPSWQNSSAPSQSVCEFTLTKFSKRKALSNIFYSTPFYTHQEGYKLRLLVCFNGVGSGTATHISVYVVIVNGEYDDQLQWPFESKIKVNMLNWREAKGHINKSVSFNRAHTGDAACLEDMVAKVSGCHQFCAHSSLAYDPSTNTEYLQDDCLRIQVPTVEVYSTALLLKTPAWQDPLTYIKPLLEFTLTKFSKRKQSDNEYYSPAFYTHKQGYKICINVVPNGYASSKGSHVSVYIYHMKGEHDDQLHWPFEGDLVLEVLNWREDKGHYKKRIECTGRIKNSNRVTETNMASVGWGEADYIPHTALIYDPTTNTEYVQDDCLRLRVVGMEVYSTDLLLKTPLWQNSSAPSQSVCEFTLTKFYKRKALNNVFYSTPFYTHPEGYKLQLKVYANGYSSGTATHISVYVVIMNGEYDDQLQWPFEGKIKVNMLNWREARGHISESVSFNRALTGDAACVVDMVGRAWGEPEFCAHSSLAYDPSTNTEYLQDDCLRIQVKSVEVYSTALLLKTPAWQDPITYIKPLLEFTLTKFSMRKQSDNMHYSPAFYTHEQGYKMCINVLPNGHGSGKGSHISVYISHMKGEHDDQLHWPFQGDLVLEVLNWREDKGHYKKIVCIGMSQNTNQVTETNMASGCWGEAKYISHTSLIHDPTTNTEYVQDDCLRLRVVGVEVYSTDLLLKTPSWQNSSVPSQSVCNITLTKFSKRKALNNVFYSTPFYTHQEGYKLRLLVYFNGEGSGTATHISVFVAIMNGEYDDQLQWPFESKIKVNMLNWREAKGHISKYVSFNRAHTGDAACVEDIVNKVRGYHQFCAHSSLSYDPSTNTEYLQDDCLRIQVPSVEIYSTALLLKTPAWQDPLSYIKPLLEFTLTKFSKRKQSDNEFYSPAFYTHEQGYKMCINVIPNGYASSKGSHVSVYIYHMKGEHDDLLHWPFEGDLVLEVLNWREDKGHYKKRIVCTGNRVTETNMANSGWGEPEYIPHTSLIHDPTTNTEYVQDDCLRLRVVGMEVYSTDLLLKTPLWQNSSAPSQSVCDFTLTKFSKRKALNNVFRSTPFYTHQEGYKLQLKVYFNGEGSGAGTHISVYVAIMKGEYDDQLQWPFEGKVKVNMLNWREPKGHISKSVSFNRAHTGDAACVEDMVNKVRGYHQFCAHSSLAYDPSTNTEYLQDDCLRMQVPSVEVYSTALLLKTPAWQDPLTYIKPLLEFTLTKFSKCKQSDKEYYSPAFYTHEQGYKICINVVPNGYASSKGSHVSVYIYHMKGEHDDQLHWPFEGDLVLEVLNWREDKGHYKKRIVCTGRSQNRNRVTETNMASGRWGKADYIPHTALIYDPTTNTEYVQDDCLQLKVVDVEVYSTDLLLKTPLWQNSSAPSQSVCEFTLTKFSKRKALNNVFYTTPFYTHQEGYKLQLKVYANGNSSGAATHISVYVVIMNGEYDDQLQWPFEGTIKVNMLNWREAKGHISKSVSFNRAHTGDAACVEDMVDKVSGYHQFCAHSSLAYDPSTNTEYLQDDCLRIQVPSVEVYSTALLLKTPAWQDLFTKPMLEFTLAKFSKRKQSDNEYYSPAFYTHKQGYKICIKVILNGYGSGKGSHVSVYIYLMKGEHDDLLHWPFQGYVILEVLNWREDKGHYKKRIVCTGNQVTETNMANSGWGEPDYIPHTSLIHDPTTNTEYVQDDCLRLRVVGVEVYSTDLLLKTPLWQNSSSAPSQSVCEFTLTKFSKRKALNNEFYSTPFYTHQEGYKLRLEVYLNGEGSGAATHISVYVVIMNGEYDDQLQWPFEGKIKVNMLNWREAKGHISKFFSINRAHTGDAACVEDIVDNGWGYHQFCAHSSLAYDPSTNTEYLQDDCLRIQVPSVEVYSTALLLKTPAWQDPLTYIKPLLEFTLTKFSKRKQSDNEYYSPAFYTHEQGYKICIKVILNGYASSKGSHVSVYIYHMKGEHDDLLHWPFEGDLILEVLNWREDKGHYKKRILCTGNRVTETNMANNGWGEAEYIPHTVLIHDPTTNTEYVQDDCLRLRVVDMEVYSTDLLLKNPLWQNSSAPSQSVCEFTFTKFSKRKALNKVFNSTPFYTHPEGYKLQLNVHANGNSSGTATHISVYVVIMNGEYDDQLQWPFEGTIKVNMLNWREAKGHISYSVSFNRARTGDAACVEDIVDKVSGYHQFCAHSSLAYDPSTNTEYLQDDCLRIQVPSVEVYSTALLLKTPAWQDPLTKPMLEFTLTKFSKRKQSDNEYYSPAFYTHKQGYKMCINVRANGYGSGKGSHVSVYICHMKGEHDDQLYWPLQGDIILEVLNWREDKRHYKKRIEFLDRNQLYTNRVTETNMASSGWGKADYVYIPHTSLIYDPTTNTKYVQDDCLRLRVSAVNVYSGPLMFKTPAWQDSPAIYTTKPLLEFTLTELTKRRELGSKEIYSNSFYSHNHGYKVALCVDLNNIGEIVIYALLLNGNHDEKLEWPAKFNFTIELLNWRENKKHCKATATGPTSKIPGLLPYIKGSKLSIHYFSLQYNPLNNTEYLQDDCLRLRVLNNN